MSEITTKLLSWVNDHIDPQYPLHSRVHPLRSFPFSEKCRWFVKRDDELSCGISGSKYRKYASLIPYLKNHHVDHVALAGSAYSNHLVGLLQLLNENNIAATLYLLKPFHTHLKGNHLFLQLLAGRTPIHYLTRTEWYRKDALIQSQLKAHSVYIPEGASMPASLPGAISLPQDLSCSHHVWDHIFIDAGSGLGAIGLLLGAHAFGLSAHVHIVLMAGDNDSFIERLNFYKHFLENELLSTIKLPSYTFYSPATAKAFGSINQCIIKEIRILAANEGILCDPLYTAKLFYTAKEIAKNANLHGNLLCIHSGGTLALSGFLENPVLR